MGQLASDIGYAVRTLLRTPSFTAVAVLTLALGIGANAAIFSLVHTILLKPLPFREPSRLIVAWDHYTPAFAKIGVSPAENGLWRQQTDLFEETAWYRHVPYEMSLSAPGAEALRVRAAFTSTNFLRTLGAQPAMGHAFGEQEPASSALISQGLWHSRFGADPGVIGRSIRLNDGEFTIVGVMPAGFVLPDWADLWLAPGPLQGDELTNPVRHAIGFIARLGAGVGETQAAARLEELAKRLADEHPKTSAGWGVRMSGLQDDLTANIRPALLMLLGAVALVLLTACGNVANLLLARASGRAKEIAVRAALGAGGWRIARQLLTESLILAAAGGALGLGVAEAGLKGLSPMAAPLDSTVLLFLAAVSCATGIAFGLAPVLQALRRDTHTAIKSGSVPEGGSGVLRSSLVVAEVALAMILVAGAGILVKSFVRLMQVDPGFRTKGLITMRIAFPASRKPADLFHKIEERVMRLPGVDGFASSSAMPLSPGQGNTSRFHIPGNPLINPDAPPAAQIRFVSPDFFRTVGVPLRSGRWFTDRDLNDQVVIINQAMAQRFWPGVEPVGQKFVTGPWGPNPTYSTIVGVAGNVKQGALDADTSLDIYYPALFPSAIAVHTSGDPQSLTNAVRREIQAVDAALPVSEVRTMDQALAESAKPRRWTMAMLALFAALAMTLAVVGIYGVMSYAVTRRT